MKARQGADFGTGHRRCAETQFPTVVIAADYNGPNRTDKCSIRRKKALILDHARAREYGTHTIYLFDR